MTRIVFGGDTMLARLVNDTILERGPRYIWGDILPLMANADLRIVNLECVIARGGRPFEPARRFYFNAGPEVLKALRTARINGVSLANNHTLDYGALALRESIEHLRTNGIAFAGAGENLAAAASPAIMKAGDLSVGLIAFADHYREYAAGPSRPGTNVIRVDSRHEDFLRVESSIRAARSMGADLVVFSMHWGPNMRQEPAPAFVDFAHAVIDAGADVFFGHSAHIFQGVELYAGKPIFYDTGDLIDDYAVDDLLRNDQQLLFVTHWQGARLRTVELFPLLIDHMQVNRARGADFEDIYARLVRLSWPFGTRVNRLQDHLEIAAGK